MYSIPGATHRLVETNGVTLSTFIGELAGPAARTAPPALLLHGFPELAYSWRYQIPALVGAGYRVIAPDQRGYGMSSRPDEVSAYDIHHLTADLTGLLDALGVDRAVIVGHDWGGIVAWQMPLLHPERVAGVAGVNTPFLPRLASPPTEVFRAMFGDDHYIVRFQESGVADRLLASNVEKFFTALTRVGVSPEDLTSMPSPLRLPKEGEELELPSSLPGAALMDDGELAVYVESFRATGFTGGINWYRNMDRNWETTAHLDGARIDGIPCLMVTAEWDPFLPPALADGMRALVTDLSIQQIHKCGHWTQQEKPDELNAIMLGWLEEKFPG